MSTLAIIGIVLILAIPLGLGAARIMMAANPGEPRTAADIARYITNALDDDPNANDWGDFVNVRIKDSALDAIRLEAERINFPLEKSDEAQLRALLKRVEALKQR